MSRTRSRWLLAILTLALVALGPSAGAAVLTVSTTAPPVDSLDIASGLGAGTTGEKLWTDTSAIGQTFTSPGVESVLDAITLQLWGSGQPTKTYTVTIGEVSGNQYTRVLSTESVTQDVPVATGDYFTMNLASPVTLQPNQLYGFDLAMNSSTTGWQSGIPYMASTANSVYPDGQAFRSQAHGQSTSPFNYINSDKVFHLNLEPAGAQTNVPLTVMGRSSGGSVWHFTSDPTYVDDPSGKPLPVGLGGGVDSATPYVPTDLVDDPFYVVVEATDTSSTPSFAGALRAPFGYVFDANNNDAQDPGEDQFFTTQGFPLDSGDPHWAASAQLVPPAFFPFVDANEVGDAGNPFPPGTESIWYGGAGGTLYLATQVPKVIQGEWTAPSVQGTPESSVTTDPGITARIMRTDGVSVDNIETAVSALTYLGPNSPGHHATSEQPITRLDVGNADGGYPGSVGVLAPDQNSAGADGDNTAARFSGYIYVDPSWDADPGPDFSYVRTFAVASDDGYRLKVGDSTILEYPDTRGMPGSPDVAPVNFPAPGYWPIELEWFNATGGSGVELSSAEGAVWDPSDWNNTDFKLLGDPTDNLQVFQRPGPAGGTMGGNGLMGWYYARSGDNFGPLLGWRNDLTTGTGSPAETEFYFPDNYAYGPWGNRENDFKVRWVGTINIPQDGSYNFRMDTDDRSSIFIDVDGDGVVDPAPGTNFAWTVTWNNVNLSAGPHKVEFWAQENAGGEWSRLQWQKPGDSGLSTVPADVFTWELTTGVGANSAGSPLVPGTIAGGETSGDGALVQAALNVSGVGNTTQAIQYFEGNPTGGTTEARTRINITDSGNAGTFGGDDEYPGATPGQNYNNIAFRARSLFYSPGNETYAFAVASDDSYRLDINGQTFGWFNGGRGQNANNSNFIYAYFPDPGLYKVALYHHEGGGDAGIEFSHKSIGTQSDLNLLVASTDPEVEGYSIDLANRFYTFETKANLTRRSTDLYGRALVHIPALNMDIPPDHWTIERLTQHYEDVPGLLGAYYVRNGDWAPGAFLGYRHDLVDPAHSLFGGPSPAQTAFNFPNNYGYGPWGNQEDNLHAIWTGTLTVPEDGTYWFAEHVDDRAHLEIDGVQILHDGNWRNYSNNSVFLTAGEHDFMFFANEGGGGEFAQLLWLPPWDTTHDPGNPSSWDFVPAQYFSFDWDLWEPFMEGSGQIGDFLNDALIQRFPWDPNTEYTLRLTVDFFGDHVVIGPETFTFIPEPATCLLLGGGLLVLMRRRRRRK